MKDNGGIKILGYITEEKHLSERVINPLGICFTLMAMTHGYGQGYVLVEDGSMDIEDTSGDE